MSSDSAYLKQRFKELSKPLSPQSTGVEPVLQKLEGIRFLIFDFYGTLFISGVGDIGIDEGSKEFGHFADALSACGFSEDRETVELAMELYEQSVETHRQRLLDRGLDHPEPAIEQVWLDVLIDLKRKNRISGKMDESIARRFAVEYEARMNPVWPMPDLDDTIAILDGLSMETGIISNSQFYTPLAFEALTGRGLVDTGFSPGLLHWSFEESVKKPSIHLYKGFLRKLERNFADANPASVLYVGNDMLKDIYPASRLNMKTALFAGDKRSLKWRRDHPDCAGLEPDLVITRLGQLIECVG